MILKETKRPTNNSKIVINRGKFLINYSMQKIIQNIPYFSKYSKPTQVSLQITCKCNKKCDYCKIGQLKKNELSTPIAKNFSDRNY